MNEEQIEKIVKTSIALPLELWQNLKIYAAKKVLTLNEVVNAAVKRYLKEEAEKQKKAVR